jgi:nucleoside-diphosphate-sugar epimerase
MSTVFVTGANGFIGTPLVRALTARGDEVRRMVWKVGKANALPEVSADEGEVLVGSLEEVDAMAAAMGGAEVVFHLAGLTRAYTRAEFEAVNTRGVRNVLAAIERAEPRPRRLVYVSSVMAAGPSGENFPLSEAHAIDEGHTLYGDSKLAGEHIAWEHAQHSDLEIIIVRPPMVYGPGEQDVLQLLRGVRAGIIGQPGLTLTTFSAVYVDDLAEGLLRAADKGRPLPRGEAGHVLAGGGAPRDAKVDDPLDPRGQGIYYFGDGGDHTMTSLGRTAAKALDRRAVAIRFPVFLMTFMAALLWVLGKVFGRQASLTLDRAKGGAMGWWCDDRRARTELGYAPEFPLDAGLRETIAWARETGEL